MIELYSLCTEENWTEAIKKCYKYNLLDINLNLLGLENILLDYSNIYVRILNVLYSIKGEHGQSIFIDNSFLNKDLRKPIDKYLQNKEIYSLSLSNAKDNYEIYKILSKTYSFERVLLAWNLKFRYKVYNYEKNIRVIDLTMNGQDIKELGIKEGKEIGLILEYMKKYKINLGLLDEENFLIDNMGEIKNAIKYKNT
ncbi:hypothetical protein [Clostridium botulinum]|uniref:tRNA nucleotidyltransferase n=1 Tax=Clostridium botulinum (strain Hall / ATCC 3502 / NCTC 13319 / Type A) TaxID=441771 RepID=A5I2Y1_CLOBH|nr:hypothetical protein [Clostridium botulinum]ABS32468.1 conserved domain protein [Clostridium botulinum A str. ATCC 19397]ABS39164.1 conserved domain protein [Clostridium botulinum A str. Hall]AWB17730.1 tRNA nucleotidyltransferase [Clostridium botulinum]AWB30516.1 tRNA nucleotidyltransferase [Clostridium botulinum]EGT5614630.1 tRNA nucleotidyltransferase [Clostridium botulinum]